MGYQALLFCADEKTARTLTQVLSELEFSVEPCTETFAAVKKLMGGHFDAVVVDCDNEQNATLLFKSARNSTSNQASLAVAVVEGQAGVAKAFRIGANLVLTKPINVEQAKGTLRVARGLLRKGEAAKPAAPVATTPTPPTQRPAAPAAKPIPVPAQPIAARPSAAPAATPATSVDIPVPAAAPVPTMAPPAARKAAAIAPPAPQLRPATPPAAPAATIPGGAAEARPASRPAPLAPLAASASSATSAPAPSFGGGAASAAAPAREAKSPAAAEIPVPSVAENDVLSPSATSASAETSDSSASPAPTFTFGGANVPETSGGGSKKILMGVAAVVVVGALLYVGQSLFSGRSAPPVNQPAVNPSAASSKPAVQPAPAPSTPPATDPSTATGLTAKPSGQTASSAPPAATPAASTANQFELEPVPAGNASAGPSTPKENSSGGKPAPAAQPADAPRVVKGGAVPKVKSQPATPDAPAPSVIGMDTSASSGPLPNLIDSSAAPTPVLQRLNISQGVSQGLLVKKVDPAYPPTAVRMQIEGPVQLLATVSKTGDISDLKILSGNPQLTRAAADAVKRWKYKPYLLNGEPVEIQTQITVNFRLPH